MSMVQSEVKVITNKHAHQITNFSVNFFLGEGGHEACCPLSEYWGTCPSPSHPPPQSLPLLALPWKCCKVFCFCALQNAQ